MENIERTYVLLELRRNPGDDKVEVLAVMNSASGHFYVLTDIELEWPLFAHDWRLLWTTALTTMRYMGLPSR